GLDAIEVVLGLGVDHAEYRIGVGLAVDMRDAPVVPDDGDVRRPQLPSSGFGGAGARGNGQGKHGGKEEGELRHGWACIREGAIRVFLITTPQSCSGILMRTDSVRTAISRLTLAVIPLLAAAQVAAAQSPDVYAGMHWRSIGPTRAGRARALAGVPSQPNVFYIGFDNGGVWRSTDYGSNWEPLIDQAPTGSIGAIAVSPSDPNVIYVGTGAGIIRPDLAIGDGVYKSTDGGKNWTHLGLFDTQMIAMIDVDPKALNRLFVAALGHPYGPNAERGIFRSTDGGKTFQKVLY